MSDDKTPDPSPSETLVARLREQTKDDHVRGCMGRQYSCDCGYDLRTEGLLELAAAEIERLMEFARWVENHSNDPGVVERAAAIRKGE